MRTRGEQYNDPRFVKELQHERHVATGARICVYIEEKPTGLPEGSSQTVGVYSGHWSTPNWNHEVKRYVSVEAMESAILEAERRAEQRVRAEIGRDSERLDWLEGQISINHACEALRTCRCGTASYTIDEWKCNKHGSLRAAIDAAREVG